MSKIFIEHQRVSVYPTDKYGFAPSEKYPEYQWNDISQEPNIVYRMVRNCLHGYGLDNDHYGTKDWNPLGKIIQKGDVVVIKPNWVEDKNENKKGGMDCLVTNASVIRAVIDYAAIALGGTGRLVVGDSPMPDCNLSILMEKAHYNAVWKSCKVRGIKIEIIDFREDIVTGFANKVKPTDGDKEVIIDLGKESFFAETEYNVGKYRNGIVDATKMNNYYHTWGHHRYGISRTALDADVIINLPKPKTHRKAGYTAALKNYVGICSRKISIPHNVIGNEKDGGDTYFGPKLIFETEQKMRDFQNRLQTSEKNRKAFLVKCMRVPFWIFRKLTHKKFFGTGNWYKNDTIWRSVLDLNRIMIYTDKQGNLKDIPQRRFFSLGDMIVAGHKNGPLGPTPIKIGCLICSEDPVAFDLGVIRLMGLDYKWIPVLNKVPEIKTFKLQSELFKDICVRSNDRKLHGKSIEDMPIAPFGFFTPAEGWEIISLKGRT